MNNLQTAKSILNKEGNTCVLCKGDIIYISKDKGIAPMVNFISKGVDLHEFSAADIIIGKAAAMLFILAGVKEVYAVTLCVGRGFWLQVTRTEEYYGSKKLQRLWQII